MFNIYQGTSTLLREMKHVFAYILTSSGDFAAGFLIVYIEIIKPILT